MNAMEDVELKAHEAWEAGDLRLALRLFSEGAAHGLEGCMIDLGYFHDVGIATRVDKQKAMYWYKRAFRKGSSAAASNIAILYREQGRAKLSFQWFERSARLGDGDAQVDLARLYLAGTGVRRSIPQARACLQKALSSTFITEAAREEAAELMRDVRAG